MLEFDSAATAVAFKGMVSAGAGSRTPRGWSDGSDQRARVTGASLVPEAGRLTSDLGLGCSGQLIGHRIIRTAAHCIVGHTTSGATFSNTMTFQYRDNAGTSLISPTQITYYYGGNYPANCTTSTPSDYWNQYRNNFDACTWADWGEIILASNWDSSTGSQWFGYQGLGSGDLNNRVMQMVGYPACGLAESPIGGVGCVNQAQYLDSSSTCRIKVFTNGTSKFLSNCDATPGDSGGAAFDPTNRYLLGHFQWQYCTTCPSGSTNRANPNEFLGHDDFLFNFQNQLRSQYP